MFIGSKNYICLTKTTTHEYFKSYISAVGSYKEGNMSDDEIDTFFKTSDKISSNFMQLRFKFNGNSLIILEDTPLHTWQTMLSMVGGCLSLWLGVTFMTAVEFLEFYLNLINVFKEWLLFAKR